MVANYRYGSRDNVGWAIDSRDQNNNPHYQMSRKGIGGTWHQNHAQHAAYGDIASGNYTTVVRGFLVFQADSKYHRAGEGSTSRTAGYSYIFNWTVPPGITEATVLCIGAGGGAAATGSNRGGGGGAGGALCYATGTVTPGDVWTIYAGASGYTSGSTVSAPGIAGGFSGIQAQGAGGTYCMVARGGEGGRTGLTTTSAVGSRATGGTYTVVSRTGCLTAISNSGGGNGGGGGVEDYNNAGGAGAGGAGYSGNGGNGAYGNNNTGGSAGAGGGASGGTVVGAGCGGGGGVGRYGQGSNGALPTTAGSGGNGGSGGQNGTIGDNASDGGDYGGGGGADDDDFVSGTNYNGEGGRGCVVIEYGYSSSERFPNAYDYSAEEVLYQAADGDNGGVFSP